MRALYLVEDVTCVMVISKIVKGVITSQVFLISLILKNMCHSGFFRLPAFISRGEIGGFKVRKSWNNGISVASNSSHFWGV